jgi:hypothetical protein
MFVILILISPHLGVGGWKLAVHDFQPIIHCQLIRNSYLAYAFQNVARCLLKLLTGQLRTDPEKN